MATKNFTQFSTNTTISNNDYLVGYYGDGSQEFKLTVNSLKTFFEPTKTVSTNAEFSQTNTTILSSVEELNIYVPANTKYAITGQLFLKEIGDLAPGIDCQVSIETETTPVGTIYIYGNHNRYDLVDFPVAVITPTDIPVTTRTKILQLDATNYNFFSIPISFVVNNSSNLECIVKHSFAQTTQTSNGTYIIGLGSYLIGHPISN
jgi:hypothetical protein